jgi:hypothetical protein
MSQTSVEPMQTGRDLRSVLSVWLPGFVVVIAAGLCLFGLTWWMSRDAAGGARLGVVVGLASADSLLWVMLLSGRLDRADRYRSLVWLLLGLSVPVTVLLYVYAAPAAGFAIALAGVCYLAIHAGQALYLAAAENMVADLAPSNWPSTRTAMLGQLPQQAGAMVAPTIAGLLVAAGALRGIASLALGALALSLVAIAALRRRFEPLRVLAARAKAATGSAGLIHDVRGAASLIRQRRELVYVVGLGILGNLVMFPFYAVLPAVIAEYDLSQRGQALLYGRAATAYALGLLVSSLLLLRWRPGGDARHLLALATLAFLGVCGFVVLAVLIRTGPTLIGALAVGGALFAVLMSAAGSIWLDRTPAAIRVRVFALRRLVTFSSIPVGTMLMGFGGAALGYHRFILGLVVVVSGLTMLWWLLFRHDLAV